MEKVMFMLLELHALTIILSLAFQLIYWPSVWLFAFSFSSGSCSASSFFSSISIISASSGATKGFSGEDGGALLLVRHFFVLVNVAPAEKKYSYKMAATDPPTSGPIQNTYKIYNIYVNILELSFFSWCYILVGCIFFISYCVISP